MQRFTKNSSKELYIENTHTKTKRKYILVEHGWKQMYSANLNVMSNNDVILQ